MRLNNLYLLAFIIAIGLSARSQTIIPGGYVSGIWDEAGSPYQVQGSIEVHADSSLFIMPGVDVVFGGPFQFLIGGYISAQGIETDSVHFHTNGGSWRGINIVSGNVSLDSIRFSYCSFMDGDVTLTTMCGGSMNIYNTYGVSIQHCSFRGNHAEVYGGALYAHLSGFRLAYSYFTENTCGGGLDPGLGGAVAVIESEVIVEHTTFRTNSASVCGAFQAENAAIVMDSCVFTNNISEGGGGAMVCHNDGSLTMDRCLFQYNEANGSGGAVAFLQGIHAHIEDCEFTQNTSQSDVYLSDGGAVLITPYDNEINFLNCEFSMNYAEDYGGALYVTSPTNVIGCLFDGNYMPSFIPSFGGAITVGETSMRIINSTFTNNDAMLGPTLFAEDAEVFMLNSILWNEGGFIEPSIFLLTNTNPPLLSVDHSNIQGGTEAITGGGSYQVHWKSGNLNVDPHFLSPGADFSLAWNSPCINAGRTDTLQLLIPAEDFAGNPRIMGGEIDMGCYEYQDPIGIPEFADKQEFMIYPNPASDYFNIKNTSGTDFTGQIYLSDLSGRRVINRNIDIQNHSSYSISVSNLPEGMYILNIASESSFEALKIIIQ